MSSFRMLRDFAGIQRWEREILKRDDHREGIVSRAFRMVPWSGVAMFLLVMLFFGVDVGAGIKNTAASIQEKKNDAQTQLETQKFQQRQWSVDQVKTFREGDVPQPSWAAGGPRDPTRKQ